MNDKRNIFFIVIFLVTWAVAFLSYSWNVREVEKNINEVVKNQARAFFSELITTRVWNAGHGGVYVPVTDDIQPNKYLDIPNRDIYTTDSILLTKINPAFMTRLIAEIAEKKDGIKYHITSLKPIRPENKADKWESESLLEFEKGTKEVFQYFEKDTFYRYMSPLPVVKACMKCHEKQGYKIGDIRGGISVTIPGKRLIAPVKKQKTQVLLVHVFVLIIFTILMIIFMIIINRQFKKIKERNNLLSIQKNELILKGTELNKANNENIKINKDLVLQKIKIEKSYHNVELLSDIGKKIVSVLSVENIIKKAYNNIGELMEVTFFSVGIYDEEKDRINFPGTIRNEETLSKYYYEMSKPNSFSGWCFLNKKEIFINDLDNEYTNYLNEYPNLKTFSAKSFIYCPLFIKEKTIGTVTVHHKEKNAFTKYHIYVLRNIAVYISLALQNAESFKKIEEQMIEIDYKNSLLKSSIKYAQTIQNSMLPRVEVMREKFNAEILFMPRDIVSGDFYWTAEIKKKNINKKFIAAVDCTGHGVPGAFLSIMGYKSLDEIVLGEQIYKPSKILYELDKKVVAVLNQEHSDNNDGMDLSICSIEKIDDKKKKIIFAGAKLPLFYYQKNKNKINYIKGSVKTIGGGYFRTQKFKDVEIITEKGDIIYLITDGYIDQNSLEYRRFGRAKFLRLLKEVVKYPIDKQTEIMKNIFIKFSKGKAQRDDVTILIVQL